MLETLPSSAQSSLTFWDERLFISMNQQQVQQLEIDDGNAIQVIDIDSNKPFAIVLPINAGNITFYDVNRNTVEYWNNPLWQFPACLTETNNPNTENQTVDWSQSAKRNKTKETFLP